MKTPLAVAGALVAIGGVAALFFYAPRQPEPVAGQAAGKQRASTTALVDVPRKAASGADAAPDLAPGAPAAATSPTPSFEQRLAAATRVGTKHAYRDVLKDWRSGRLTREQDRAVADFVGGVRSLELDKAAGQVLLAGTATPSQRQALGAILAASGSDDAVGYLLAACKDPALRPEAVEALATVSEPGALPQLSQSLTEDTPPEVLNALLRAARNIDADKARELEARIRDRLDGR